MIRYIFKRIGYGFLVLFGVILVVFVIFHALPGDPVAMLAGQRTDVATRESIARELGLREPLRTQFMLYLNDLSPVSYHKDTPFNQEKYDYYKLLKVAGDHWIVVKRPYLRRSFQSNRRVDEILMENIESTFVLAFFAMFLATVIGILAGVIAALNRNNWIDHFIISISVFGISIPTFLSAIVFAIIFGYYLSDWTGLNLTGQLWVTHPILGKQLQLKNIILPAITLGIRPLSIIVQLTRSSMLDVMSKDYIRTARAKGLSSVNIFMKHALKNAINPVITAVTGWLASLMAGAFFVEYIFDWKGLGFVTIKAVQSLDFPVVMGSTLLIAIIFIIINIFVDILYAAVDPRIRLTE
jgi:ABC-type dipeptide/oligopeptide/nickel transport system permease component